MPPLTKSIPKGVIFPDPSLFSSSPSIASYNQKQGTFGKQKSLD